MPKRYRGREAVAQAAKYYNQQIIDPIAEHIIMEEGFVPGVYPDPVKGIPTEGVGMIDDNIGKNFFTEVLPIYEQRARSFVPSYAKQPLSVQKAIMSAVYRGDMGDDTAELINKGEYKKASKEFLNHDGYRALKKKDPNHGVVKRLERTAEMIAQGANP